MTLLHTPRLSGRQITENDWPFFLSLYRDRQVMRYIGDPLSMAQIRQRFEQRLPAWQPDSQHWLCLLLSEKQSGEPIGLSGFCLQQSIGEAGFIFSPRGQGKGYAAESLNWLTEFFFRELAGHRLFCQVTDGNEACIRLMARCGFRQEARLRQNFRLAETWHDDLIFARLSTDPWPI